MSHIMLSKLRLTDIPDPHLPDAAEVKVVRERDLEGFMVAMGIYRRPSRDSRGILTRYFTVRNPAWEGYKTAGSMKELRQIISSAP